MEPIHRKEFTVSQMHLDCFGRCKPSALLYFAQEAAEAHCLVLNADWDTLQKKGLFWAIIRQQMQIAYLPRQGQTLTVETWPMPTTKVAYPRSTVAYDEAGREVFRCIGLWVLMDSRTRAMIPPAKSQVLVPGTLRGNELASPSRLPVRALAHRQSRTVRYSELDRNAHMNNTRYLDWLMDLLPSPFHRAHTPRDITLIYHAEAREQEALSLNWELGEDLVLTVDAHRQHTDVPTQKQGIFSAQVKF